MCCGSHSTTIGAYQDDYTSESRVMGPPGSVRKAFTFQLNNLIQPGLVTVGTFDGTHPSLICSITGGRLLVHSPHEQQVFLPSQLCPCQNGFYFCSLMSHTIGRVSHQHIADFFRAWS